MWDTKVTGFGARRQREAGGVHYVLKSKDRWHTIGKHGSPFTVEMVRAEALRLLGLIVSSKDPRSARCKKCRERALREGQSPRGMCNAIVTYDAQLVREAAMQFARRKFLHLAAGTAAVSAASYVASAQTYPTRPIALIVPIAAGGALDTGARIVGEKLQEKLRQPVLVENRPGAGSTLGAAYVAKAKPDGYTLLLIESSVVWMKWLTKNAPFDVINDLTPIAMFANAPLVLFAHPSFAANNVKELISYSRANPGKVSVGTAGVSTPHHLATAWLNTAAKIEITHVPYRGAAPALNDLLGGQIPLMWATPIAVMPFVEQGKVKVLGVATRQRIATLPQVATVAESGVPGFAVDIWLGIAAPANVPTDIVTCLDQTIREASELPEVQRRLSAVGLNSDYRNATQFRELIVSEHQKYGMIIREAGIQPE